MALTRVNGNLITSGTITGNLFGGATITGDKSGLTAITSNLIATNAVTSDKIASAITLNNVSVASVSTFLGQIVERANVTSAMSATLTVPSTDTGVIVFTANSSANATINFTGLGSLPVGNLASYVVMVPNSSTAYYINTYQVDGSGVTVKWAGGVPIGGTSANTDIYSFNIVKTSATPTYNVFASIQSYF